MASVLTSNTHGNNPVDLPLERPAGASLRLKYVLMDVQSDNILFHFFFLFSNQMNAREKGWD